MEYPERIYKVLGNGDLFVFVLSNHLPRPNGEIQTWPDKFGMPYIEYRMLEFRSDDGWKLIDYEREIAAQEKLSFYCVLSLPNIENHLKGIAPYQSNEVWTTDLDVALPLSKQRYDEHYPTGKSYDVIKYFDNCDPHKVNSEPLLYSEAVELKKKCEEKRRMYDSWQIKVHKD